MKTKRYEKIVSEYSAEMRAMLAMGSVYGMLDSYALHEVRRVISDTDASDAERVRRVNALLAALEYSKG